jgi:hypothetical protein
MRNHDYKVRLFMGAMRVPHELDFYGLHETRAQNDTTPYGPRNDRTEKNTTSSIESDALADRMASSLNDDPSEQDEIATVAEGEEHTVTEVEERALPNDDRAKCLEDNKLPEIDLIIFS